MRVDRLRDHRWLGGGRRSIVGHRLRGERRPRESDPQLSAAQSPFSAALVVGRCDGRILLLQQLEPFVCDGMQTDVIPRAQLLRGAESERLARSFRFDCERLQHVRHFADPQPTVERDGAEVVAMEPSG